MIIIVQQAYPAYRHGFFSRLYEKIGNNFTLYYSCDENILPSVNLISNSTNIGVTRKLFWRFKWQSNAAKIPINKCDIVVIPGDYFILSNLFLLVKSRLCFAKVIVWSHLYSSTSNSFFALIRLFLSRYANGILLYYKKEVELFPFHDKTNLFFLNNAIETKDINFLRKPYLPSERPKKIVFIGRLTTKSNILLLLQSMVESPDFYLDIIGSGPLFLQVKKFISAYNLENRVVLHGELVREIDISRVMNHALLFVYPGSIGLSLLHAMAYGIPAIIHDNDSQHMPEYLVFENNSSGRQFKFNNASSLSNTINNLANDFSCLTNFSNRSLYLIDRYYNAKHMSNNFINCIDSVSDV